MSVQRPPQLEGAWGDGRAPKPPSHAFFTRSGEHLPAGLAVAKALVCLVTAKSGRVGTRLRFWNAAEVTSWSPGRRRV